MLKGGGVTNKLYISTYMYRGDHDTKLKMSRNVLNNERVVFYTAA